MQDALVSEDVTELETLGDRADSIMSHPRRQGPLVCNVSAADPNDNYPNEDSPASVNCLCHNG